MSEKRKILILVILIVIFAGSTVALLLWRAYDSQPAPEASVPAVEDSIFDDESQLPPEDVNQPSVEEQPQENAQEDDPASDTTLESDPNVDPVPLPAPGELSYEDYNAMSAASQRAYMESFENVDDFFVWYYEAKDAYDAAHPDIDVGDGVIDLEDLMPNE